MERASQLILRNRDLLPSDGILLLNPPPDDLFHELAVIHPKQPQARAGKRDALVRIWTQDYGNHLWFLGHGAESEFGVLPEAASLPRQPILFLPREKDLLALWLHFLAASMPATGNLWLVGENQSGIRSAARHLKEFFQETVKTDNARHCALFSASQARPGVPFLLDDYQQKWLLEYSHTALRMVSLPGTFAHGRLDRGTELLLQTVSEPGGSHLPRGSVLDFACGIGVIGLSLLLRDPTLELTLLDNSALALESARRSLLANELQAELLPSDGLTEVARRYDWIVSNPPFHRGVSTNLDITRRFIENAHTALTKQGKILLVCNSHLPYEGWLSGRFASVEILAHRDNFKVLQACRPKT